MTPIQQSGAEPGYRVGVDVGGTKIEAALVSPDGEIVASRRIPARRGGDRLVDDVTAIVRDVAGDRLAGVRAVGIGTPGQVDSAAGRIANVVNLGIDTLELGPLVSGRLGVPVHVDNDVNAAALGAARSVVGSDLTGIIAFLNFGTGLAAGILIDGELQHGFSGAAGEIGHIPVDPNRLPCQCGQRGCLETVCSGASVGRLWPTENGAPPMPDLIRAAHAGDEHAVEVLGKVAHAMVDTIQILAQSVDPRIIILGGGMAKTGEPLVEVIAGELSVREAACPFLAGLHLGERLRLAPQDRPTAALGAALA